MFIILWNVAGALQSPKDRDERVALLPGASRGQWWRHQRVLRIVVKIVQRRIDLRDCLTRVRTARRRRQSRFGPLSLVMEALTELGWSWTGTWQVCREAVLTDLLTVDIAVWAHMMREALRIKRWRQASARRMEFNGLEHGVDRESTNML